MGFFLLIAFLFYGIPCYLNYLIVAKFNPNISVWENFVPIWNLYILAKQVMPKPGLYMLAQIVVSVINIGIMVYIIPIFHQSGPAVMFIKEHEGLFNTIKVLNMVQGVLIAYLWGQVAKGLGKNFWIYAVLAYFGLPLFVIVPMFALDSSKPIKTFNE